MDESKKREIASKGGHAAHEKGTAHEFTPDEARKAGKRGGEVVSRDKSHMASIGKKGGQAVSKNRDHMAAIGRKGGEAVSRDRSHMATIGRRGGESVSRDREHMATIGREGGESRATPRELEKPIEAEKIEAQAPAPAEPGAIPAHEFPRAVGEEKPEEKREEGEGRRAA
jgi:general stress protein YciG